MDIFFSGHSLCFYPGADADYYRAKGTWPTDAVELTADEVSTYWRKNPPEGSTLGQREGRPFWTKNPVPTREEVQALRQAEYRKESDPIKIEADYDALINGTEPDYTAWLAKVEEIKERLPLP